MIELSVAVYLPAPVFRGACRRGRNPFVGKLLMELFTPYLYASILAYFLKWYSNGTEANFVSW